MISEGQSVFVVTPNERRLSESTSLSEDSGCHVLRVKTLNIQKTNIIEKGLGTLLLEHRFKRAIKKFYVGIKFDLIIYSTPPITLTRVIKFIKKRDSSKSYLLLKDIFPQNAIDLNMILKGGLLHRYFRHKESSLYKISDRIGCMSPANFEYLCNNNPGLNPKKVHINPNSIEIKENQKISEIQKTGIRFKYNIPSEITVFIYGGNLGKPQGINFLISTLNCYLNSTTVFFIIAGSGTEYEIVSEWFGINKPTNAILLPLLPKKDFEDLLAISDVGLIYLDSRFTIPNFPSRLLSYLEFSLPVIASTDLNSDLGRIAQEHGFGLWCESGDLKALCNHIDFFEKNPETGRQMGEKGLDYLKTHWTVDVSYSLIFEA
jgi:glycosyltransferase involved in cell wall biosynthesis